jgi:hypothetical protein
VFDHLIHGLWHFLHAEGCRIGDGVHGRAVVDFSDLIDAAWLDKEVGHLRAQGRLPGG